MISSNDERIEYTNGALDDLVIIVRENKLEISLVIFAGTYVGK